MSATVYVHFDVDWSLIFSHLHTATLILFFPLRLSFSPLDAFSAFLVFPLRTIVRVLFFNLQLPILVLGAFIPFSVSLLKLTAITFFSLPDDSLSSSVFPLRIVLLVISFLLHPCFSLPSASLSFDVSLQCIVSQKLFFLLLLPWLGFQATRQAFISHFVSTLLF